MDAVDPELGELVEDMRLGFALASERDAVEVRRAVDHVELQRRRILEMLLDGAVDLAELLFDRRVAGGIHAGQATEADEALEQCQWSMPSATSSVGVGWLTSSSYCCRRTWARRPTRASAGLHTRYRSGTRVVRTVCSPCAPPCTTRSSNRPRLPGCAGRNRGATAARGPDAAPRRPGSATAFRQRRRTTTRLLVDGVPHAEGRSRRADARQAAECFADGLLVAALELRGDRRFVAGAGDPEHAHQRSRGGGVRGGQRGDDGWRDEQRRGRRAVAAATRAAASRPSPGRARRRGQRRPDAGTEREDDGVRRGAAFRPSTGQLDDPPGAIRPC